MLAVVSDYDVGKSKSIDDYLLEGCLDLALGYAHQEFCFYPFSEVVDGNKKEPPLIKCQGKQIEYVHPPL